MRPNDDDSKPDSPSADTLALMALIWTIEDERRADRLLSLTGLDVDTLRAGIGDPSILSAILGFLADHEPDLVACADALSTTPQQLIAAKESLIT